MTPINPHHSRPLDVHRWSDHPEVNGVVREVWEEVFGEDGPKKPGPKPARRQGFWHQERPKLRESLAHLVVLIMRRVVCDASVAFRASFV